MNNRDTKKNGEGMRVLVTGGLGFVGSALCCELARRNVDLYVLDNESRGKLENVVGVHMKYFKADIRDKKRVDKVFGQIKPDVVIHLAAMHFIPDCNKDPMTCLDINILGTENILRASRQNSVHRVLVTSSMAVYPVRDGVNFETDPAMPGDVYGESKLSNEMQAGRFQRETGIDTVAIRLSNVYGPRETNPHVIPEIMEQISAGKNRLGLGNMEPLRDFIYTTDVAQGFSDLAFKELPAGFHVVNMGSGKEICVRQVLEKISQILERNIVPIRDEARYRTTDRMHLLPDIYRIRELVGWEPKVGIDEGLRVLCQWYGLSSVL